MKYTNRFENKVAIVTGGASGIGRAIAYRFVQDGGKIVVGDVNEDGLKEVEDDLGSENCICVKCDVSTRNEVDNLIEIANKTFGSLDIVFGAAGINILKSLLDFSEEDNDIVFDINYKGIFNLTQAAVKNFIDNKVPGVIVNVSSINVRCAGPNSAVYAATKGAINSFTRAVAVEFAPHGIRANCIAPGVTNTGMINDMVKERFPNYTAPKLLVKRMSTPEDQANLACFLASEEAEYITGETYFNVGGWGVS